MPSPNIQLLTEAEVSEALKVPRKTLEGWRVRGIKDLPWHKIGRAVRYRASDVVAFIERNRAV